MSIDAIVFDFFGVICSEVAPFWLAKHFPHDSIVAIKEQYVAPADAGTVSQEEMLESLSRLTGVSAEAIDSEWHALAVIDHRMIELVRRLGTQVRLGLLTNSAAPFFRRLCREHDLERLFDCIVVSAERHVVKPQPDSYLTMMRELSSAPSRTLMIDDNSRNVAGALSVGMDAILFSTYDELCRVLRWKVDRVLEKADGDPAAS